MSYPSRDLPGWWRRCLLAALLSASSFGAAAQEPAAQPSPADRTVAVTVEARIEDGLLTLRADGAPLAEVLRAIGEAGAFPVLIRGELNALVSISLAEQPLEGVIRRLVGSHTVIFVRADWAPEPGASDLAEVRVIENRSAAAARNAEPPDPKVADDESDETLDDARMDRASFREARRGLPPTTRDGLLVELEGLDPAARVAAVPKVGSLRPREAIEVISHVFANDDEATVRSRAVAALTRLDGPGARALLRARALSDDDLGLRMQALNVLASSRGERAVNILSQALRQDPEPQVRLSAIRALGRVGGVSACRMLERAARDRDPKISRAAEQALAARPEPAN